MQDDLARIEQTFSTTLREAGGDLRRIDDVRVRFLGRKGELTALMKGLGRLPKDERPEAGAAINRLKQRVSDGIDAAVKRLFDLATRSLAGLPLSFPTTTGAAAPAPGGRFEKTYG